MNDKHKTFFKVEFGSSSCRFDDYDGALKHAEAMVRIEPSKAAFVFKLVSQVHIVPNLLSIDEYD